MFDKIVLKDKKGENVMSADITIHPGTLQERIRLNGVQYYHQTSYNVMLTRKSEGRHLDYILTTVHEYCERERARQSEQKPTFSQNITITNLDDLLPAMTTGDVKKINVRDVADPVTGNVTGQVLIKPTLAMERTTVDLFAKKMFAKLQEAALNGAGGWATSNSFSIIRNIVDGLNRANERGDYVSIANYAMMLDWHESNRSQQG